MATIRDITTLCRAGNITEAYEIAKTDLAASPQNVWVQREVGWALYYMIKRDVESNNVQDFHAHLEEFIGLELLTVPADNLIFENVLWKLAEYLKLLPKEAVMELSWMLQLLKKYTFAPSRAYSFLLKSGAGFTPGPTVTDFFEWWNLDNLMPEDYLPFKMENGRQVMSLAEQVYIAYSKSLLALRDTGKIEAFLPIIEKLNEQHPEMMYPGYFCGKLMLALGTGKDEALSIVMPFVRKKQSEFWVWQLLGEFHKEEPDLQLACLLKAVYCKTQESFIGKVRIKIIALYLAREDYARAKHHLDQITRCYVEQGWNLPYEVQNWIRDHWVNTVTADKTDGVDYKRLTASILTHGTHESLAIVTYVDREKRRVALIYGNKKRTVAKLSELHVKVKEGSLLKLYWMPAPNDGISIVYAESISLASCPKCEYIRIIEGSVEKPQEKPFAFIKDKGFRCFISPNEVQKYSLNGGETVSAIAAYCYNKKKDEWSWTCVSLKKK